VAECVFFVTCPRGVDYLLGDELRELGLEPFRNAPAGVWARGDLAGGYRACLWSRLASRVILHLDDVPANSADGMLEATREQAWEDHIPVEGRFRVTFQGRNDEIRNTQFGAQKVKDGIVDRFREISGKRPSVDSAKPDVTVSARLNRGTLSLGIDLSGDSLHRRGYRIDKGQAPLRESLAAALLIRAGWPEIAAEGGDFYDPMCGSGTIAIEAAMMACDMAPGRKREHWGFEGWKGHDPELWLSLRQEAERRAHEGRQGKLPAIVGHDQDSRVIATAWRNIQRAGLEGVVHVECQSIGSWQPEGEVAGQGLVLTNPPYGERLSEKKELAGLYQSLGSLALAHFAGWRLGVFTGAPEFGKSIGLRSYRKYKLFNGKLPAQLLLFEVSPDNAMTPRNPLEAGEVRPRIANPERAAMLANRLRKNRKTIGQWARKQGISCYRLYDADMPEFAMAIDIYDGQIHVQEYAAPKTVDEKAARERLQEALAVIPDALETDPNAIVCKQRQRQSGLNQYEKQDASGEFFTVQEHGCLLRVNLKDYLDTGLFLDHRPVRHWIQQHSAGKRFLNLFCYTGAATVHAVAGGSTRSLSLDMSRTYVNWAKENLALNQADPERHRVEQADCLEWLTRKPGRDEVFDLIFMDPPTFSNSARMAGVLDIQKDHGDLVRQAMARLSSDGLLIFSNNFRRFRLDESLESEFEVEEVSRDTIDRDFQRNPRIHRCWHIRHSA